MGVSLRAEVNARDIAYVMRVLKRVDKSLADEFKQTIKPAITPLANMIGNKVNASRPPMSGMTAERIGKPSRYEWAKGRITVSVTPGFSRRSPDLVQIRFRTPTDKAGIAIAENAGSLTGGKNIQGQRFIQQIVNVVPGWPNGGRYLYRMFMPYKPHILRLGENILNRWTERVNRELESR